MPLVPSGFNISRKYYTVSNLTLTFEWDEPQGSGPQAVVDNYTISISPRPLYPSDTNIRPSLPRSFNVTLNYNTMYMATISAENCAGKSDTFSYPERIYYGNVQCSLFFEIVTYTSLAVTAHLSTSSGGDSLS